eukprot:TRINITY_DN5554_c0_g1_i1.p2 TRINITY_DN5554_c0_g1~~TRINITY_DN5554_c0_g1_i1.p2  ORF type:complete len:54 (+),score=1.49 TRINITY_DN5554_c0_g1_i1:153-314(+)
MHHKIHSEYKQFHNEQSQKKQSNNNNYNITEYINQKEINKHNIKNNYTTNHQV